MEFVSILCCIFIFRWTSFLVRFLYGRFHLYGSHVVFIQLSLFAFAAIFRQFLWQHLHNDRSFCAKHQPKNAYIKIWKYLVVFTRKKCHYYVYCAIGWWESFFCCCWRAANSVITTPAPHGPVEDVSAELWQMRVREILHIQWSICCRMDAIHCIALRFWYWASGLFRGI